MNPSGALTLRLLAKIRGALRGGRAVWGETDILESGGAGRWCWTSGAHPISDAAALTSRLSGSAWRIRERSDPQRRMSYDLPVLTPEVKVGLYADNFTVSVHNQLIY